MVVVTDQADFLQPVNLPVKAQLNRNTGNVDHINIFISASQKNDLIITLARDINMSL